MSKFTLIKPQELDEQITRAVEAAMDSNLQNIVDEASKKECLNTREVMEEFDIPYRSQKYLRDTFQLPYIQYGNAIIYLRSDILSWISLNRIKYKRIYEKRYSN